MDDFKTTYIIECYDDPYQADAFLVLRRKGREFALYVARKMADAGFDVDVWQEGERGTTLVNLVSATEGILSF